MQKLTAAVARDPFGSGTMQSEEPLIRKKESPSIWVFSGWYILIIPHMHTFTVQDAPVCYQLLKSSEVKHAATSAVRSAAKLHRTESAPTVSGVTL